MEIVELIHQTGVYGRRVRVLGEVLAPLLSPGARVLDVGCGDGCVSAEIAARRPDVILSGIDVLARPSTRIPVQTFDGRTLPLDSGAVDDVLLVDVLHHAEDPGALLDESLRVARRGVVLKDHARNGWLAGPVLEFMDRVGNARHGVALPYHYWSREEWRAAFDARGLAVRGFRDRIPLYPGAADWVFGRRLHFIARLERT